MGTNTLHPITDWFVISVTLHLVQHNKKEKVSLFESARAFDTILKYERFQNVSYNKTLL